MSFLVGCAAQVVLQPRRWLVVRPYMLCGSNQRALRISKSSRTKYRGRHMTKRCGSPHSCVLNRFKILIPRHLVVDHCSWFGEKSQSYPLLRMGEIHGTWPDALTSVQVHIFLGVLAMCALDGCSTSSVAILTAPVLERAD